MALYSSGTAVVGSLPYLSFVVTSRNDNHGGRLLFRMQTFVDCLADQCNRYRLPAELVLVEWNPPPNQPQLAEALRWPKPGSCSVRIIEVSAEIHQRFEHSEKLGLYQMRAKNAGIRRAQAPFVLATNVDILFSDELMGFLASKCLREDRMYRIDRCDVPADVPEGVPVTQLLEFCRRNVTRIHTRWGSIDAKTGRYADGAPPWKAIIGDFCGALTGRPREKRLHTNASGDFTLLSKETWFKIRGYPELAALSVHIDGLGCQTAYYSGVREQILAPPMQIYHIEHSADCSSKPEGDGALMARADSEIPQLPYSEYREIAIRMRRECRPIVLNQDNWGLQDHGLREQRVC